MNMNRKSYLQSRRQFLEAVTVGSLSLGIATMIPSMALAKQLPTATWQTDSNIQIKTDMDEALGNYPAYSEPVGFGRAHLHSNDQLDSDPHFML